MINSMEHGIKVEAKTTDAPDFTVRVPELSAERVELEKFAAAKYEEMMARYHTAHDKSVAMASALITKLTLRDAELQTVEA
jgi:hypothetical protein